jgi:hypothetical protein
MVSIATLTTSGFHVRVLSQGSPYWSAKKMLCTSGDRCVQYSGHTTGGTTTDVERAG